MEKKSAKRAVANVVKLIADKMAKFSYGTASGWGMYQAKEPNRKNKWQIRATVFISMGTVALKFL